MSTDTVQYNNIDTWTRSESITNNMMNLYGIDQVHKNISKHANPESTLDSTRSSNCVDGKLGALVACDPDSSKQLSWRVGYVYQ